MKENIITYVIISNGRSRSTLLRSFLLSTGVAGTPEQWGRDDTDLSEKSFLAFLDSCRLQNVQGFSIKFHQLHFIQSFLAKMDCKYIFLRRENKIRQAISALKVRKTGHASAKTIINDPPLPPTEEDFQFINTHSRSYTINEIYSKDFFQEKGIRPFELYYKDLDTHEKRSKKVVDILNFLGISAETASPIKTDLVSQHTVWNDEVYRLYKEYLCKKEFCAHD